MRIVNTQLADEPREEINAKCLGEDVRNLSWARNVGGGDEARLKFFMNNMTINVYVFCAYMEDGITSNVYCRLIVTIEEHWLIVRNAEVIK